MTQHKQQDAVETSPTPTDDQWRYGYRYVPFDTLDGTTEYTVVPLTLEEALYPQEGDQVVHSDLHQRRCVYL